MNLIKFYKRTLFLILLTGFLVGIAEAQTFKARVVGVIDGDTIRVLDANNNLFVVRLAGIDAPESRQEFGTKAKYNLSNLIFGKEVSIISTKTDKYRRIIGKVMLGGLDICLRQIADGFAWHYKEYEKEQSETDRKLYAETEKTAKLNSRGLWLQEALPPWEWRAKKSANGSESPTPASPRIQESLNSTSSGVSNSESGPSNSGGNKTVQVKGYTRKDGIYVPPHTRSAPKRKN